MELITIIERILREQKESPLEYIPIDIKLTNGNIVLRSFRIYELNKMKSSIKGITFQEEYIHLREARDPAFCIINIGEIKEISCSDLDFHFSQDPYPTFSLRVSR